MGLKALGGKTDYTRDISVPLIPCVSQCLATIQILLPYVDTFGNNYIPCMEFTSMSLSKTGSVTVQQLPHKSRLLCTDITSATGLYNLMIHSSLQKSLTIDNTVLLLS